MSNNEIVRNMIQCLKCGDIIESEYTHDFKWCSCKNCAVDGGKSYLKRSAVDVSAIKDLSIIRNSKGEEIQVHG